MMKDPYSVLGVTPNASDEEVKKAYRSLARKYHPDAYADNPLSDLAQEKMQEINEAYDQIMDSRKNGSSGGYGGNSYSGGSYGGSYDGNTGNSQYSDVRNMISSGRYEDAQEILDGVPLDRRNAEWYFLNGSVLYKRGWFDNAFTSFSTACRMDPNNLEYRQALNHVQRQRGGFNGYGGYRGAGYGNGSNCDGCDICQGLICADCCCECMGGDLIRCC